LVASLPVVGYWFVVIGFLTANATPTVGGVEHAMVVGF
jgi:hypothetical protein